MASGIIEQRFGKSDIQGHGNTVKQGVFYESPCMLPNFSEGKVRTNLRRSKKWPLHCPALGQSPLHGSTGRARQAMQAARPRWNQQRKAAADASSNNGNRRVGKERAVPQAHRYGARQVTQTVKSFHCRLRALTTSCRYENIFWVDVGDYDAAEQAFMSISHRLGFQAQGPREAVQCVAGLQQTWLLVLDNADDPNKDYHPYFPAGSQGTVVITSRNPACGREYGRDCHEELKALDREQTTDLLLQAADLALSSSLRLVAGKIVETLGDRLVHKQTEFQIFV